MPSVRLAGGWYKVIAVFTKNPDDRELANVPKLWLPVGEYPCVTHNQQHWYGIKYPDPTKGGIIYVRLVRLALADKPCRCPRLRFPHKRNDSCEGGPDGAH